MKKIVYLLWVALIGVALVLMNPAVNRALAGSKPVLFKAVAFLPVNNANVAGFRIFADKVNEKFKDHLKVELIGGPEVTPPFQLHEAVKNGVIDMTLTSCGYFPSLLWEAQTAMYTNKNFREIAQTDYFELMSKLYEKVGLIYLGDSTQGEGFHLFTNFRPKGLGDFKGKKIRVFPPFIPLIKALGAVPVNLPMGDIYTAMERGTVDGFVMTHFGFVTDFSWHEVTKYVIDYPLYKATAVILVNPKQWNRLSPEVRKAVIEFKARVVDPAVADYYGKEGDANWQLMIDKGVEPIRFSPAEAEAFLKLAYDAAWDRVISKSPELGPKLKAMLVK